MLLLESSDGDIANTFLFVMQIPNFFLTAENTENLLPEEFTSINKLSK